MSRRVTEYRETPQTREIVEREQAEIKSRVFYTQIGYPQYSGRYAPVSVPEGSQVSKIEEKAVVVKGGITTSQLEVTIEPKKLETMKSISEQIVESGKPSIKEVAVGVKSDPMFLFKQQQKTTAKEFVGGAVASGENLVFGGVKTAVLLSNVFTTPKLLKESLKLVAERGPQPPATVSSGLIGKGVGFVTGQPSYELEKATKSPAYAVGSVFGDILLSAGFGTILKGIRGGKVTKIIGAKEQEISRVSPKTLESSRITEYLTKTKRVPISEAKKIRSFQRLTTPTQIGLGGSEVRSVHYVDDVTKLVHKGAEAWRDPSPILKTVSVSQKQSLIQKALQKLHIVKKGDKIIDVTSKQFISKGVKIQSKAVGFVSKSGKAFVQSSEKLVGKPHVYPYGSSMAKKTFTGVIIEGSIDTQAYLKLVKAVGPEVAQKWYPQMGGISASIIQKTLPKTIKLVSSVVGVQMASGLGSSLIGVTASLPSKIISGLPSELITKYAKPIPMLPFVGLSPIVNAIIPTSRLSSIAGVGFPQKRATPLTFNVPIYKIDSELKLSSGVISDVDQHVTLSSVPDSSVDVGLSEKSVYISSGGFPVPVPLTPAKIFPSVVGTDFVLRGGSTRKSKRRLAGKQKRKYPIKTAKDLLKELL